MSSYLVAHLKLLCILTLVSVLAVSTRAQNTAITDQNVAPIPDAGHNYLGALNETVSPATGKVSVEIGTAVPPGLKLTVPFSIGYTPLGNCLQEDPYQGDVDWFCSQTPTQPAGPFTDGNWSFVVPQLSRFGTQTTVKKQADGSTQCAATTGYTFVDASGAQHNLQLSNVYDYLFESNESDACKAAGYVNAWTGGDAVTNAALVRAASGQFNNTNPGVYEGFPTISDPDGTKYAFSPYSWCGNTSKPGDYVAAVSITDRNGNGANISAPSPCEGALTLTDSVGRTAVSANWGTGNVTVAGLSHPYTLNRSTISYSGYSFSIKEVDGLISGSCNNGASFFPAGSPSAVTSLTLPNGQEYAFTYDPVYGTLGKITYPTGGYISYAWGLNPLSSIVSFNTIQGPPGCAFQYDAAAVQHRYVSFDGATIALQQDFSYQTTWGSTKLVWTAKSTTVTTHDLVRSVTFQTVYTYSPVISEAAVNSDAAYTQIPVESMIQYYGTNGTLLKTVKKGWNLFDASEMYCQLTTIGPSSTSGPTYGTYYKYGPGGQITDIKEYDYGILAATTTPGCTVPQNPPTPTRETVTTYQTGFPTPTGFAGPVILDRPCTIITKDSGGNVVSESDYYYDGGATLCGGNPTAGNATKIVKRCLQSGAACSQGDSVTTYAYDSHGQVTSMTDALSNEAQYSYTDVYTPCSGAPPPTSPSDAYLTQITFPQTNGVNHIVDYCYDYATGLLLTATDENGQVTTYKYSDPLNRLTETDDPPPNGGQTKFSYNDAPPAPTVTTTTELNSSQNRVTVEVSDGLGHLVDKELTDPQGEIYSISSANGAGHPYDGLGHAFQRYNPYRSASDQTYGYTTYVYDALGRTTSVTEPDGSVVSTQYCNNPAATAVTSSVLVTDEAGRWRRSQFNGLGRLVEVDEPNSATASVGACPAANDTSQEWQTTYTYDALNNLIGVLQGGRQLCQINGTNYSRCFTYNSLKQLIQSVNPESGTLAYAYDAVGNVHTKQDARSITTTYSYDALNRISGMTYSNGDPSVAYTYDQSACLGQSPCYNIGHRTTMTDAGGTELLVYDQMGREIVEQRITNSVTKSATYAYDLAGDLISLTYPSGRTITYTYDSAGRPSDAVDTANAINYAVGTCLNGATSPSTGVCYAPQGALSQIQNGTNLVSTYLYNTRLQPCWMYATTGSALATNTSCTAGDSTPGNILDLNYNFNLGSGDNDNVIGIANNRDTTRSQTFTYDQVNRILTAAGSTYATKPADCWGETYTYDQWANMTAIGVLSSAYNGCTQDNLSVSATTSNQLSATGFSYDASGNMLSDGANTYGYNGESEIKSAAGVNYTYDGDGNRLEKSNGKLYWYGAGTEILDESDASGNFTNEYIFFGGKRVAMRNVSSGTIYYYEEDMLGSSRTMVQAGQTSPCYDADFRPFGSELAITNTCTQNYKFEGKERDTETNNDDFGARYYSSRIGRWLSADWSSAPAPVPYANLTNPQTLNLYAMVSDNPETFADLDGHILMLEGNIQADAAQICEIAGGSCGDFGYNAASDTVTFSCTSDCDHLTGGALWIKAMVESPGVFIFEAQTVGTSGDIHYIPKITRIIQTCDGKECTERKILEEVRSQIVIAIATEGLGEVVGLARLAKTANAGEETVSVYTIVKGGVTSYVGITNNLVRRAAEHGAPLELIVPGLIRDEARGVEQALIDYYGLAKNGGTLTNKINSIAKTNAMYDDMVTLGKKVLDDIGYK